MIAVFLQNNRFGRVKSKHSFKKSNVNFYLLKCQYPLLLIFRYKQAIFTFLYPLKGFFLYKDIF